MDITNNPTVVAFMAEVMLEHGPFVHDRCITLMSYERFNEDAELTDESLNNFLNRILQRSMTGTIFPKELILR